MSTTHSSLCLPDEIVTLVRTFAKASAQVHRAMAHALLESGYLDEMRTAGMLMQAYDLIAAEWYHITGEQISARTVRYWIHSVTDFTAAELKEYSALTDAQLVTASSLATIANAKPQDICNWAKAEATESVPAMRAHWLPQTTYEQGIDLPVVSGLIRYADKHLPADRRERFDALVTEIRALFANG